ncbi:MAG: SprT family zinc-dependent metalloprotease [Prolixibacteraceae bacterium]|nr:SprT family zinc-dependent metalloprotease [Prolixibacteraceae bacterium]
MKSKIIHIDAVGEVALTRRKGSRRISVRVKSDGIVSVNYPWFATQGEVLNFLKSNTVWIKHQQQKVATQKIVFHLNQLIQTKWHSIKIVSVEDGKLRAVIQHEEVVITVPLTEEVTTEKVQHFIRKIVTEICRKEAKQFLPERVGQLAIQFGFEYQKVFIKNLKSKWGSCSSLGNINLNLHLMRLPSHLIDYIILHELTHTKQMNHGPQFWQLLNVVTDGNARLLDKQMKTQSRIILK